jgi:hypothetical protein
MTRKLLVLLVLAAAAPIAANVLLLGSAAAGNDPVGRLSPSGYLPAAPNWIIRPTTGHPHDEGADD